MAGGRREDLEKNLYLKKLTYMVEKKLIFFPPLVSAVWTYVTYPILLVQKVFTLRSQNLYQM